jgi:hypothetical protein
MGFPITPSPMNPMVSISDMLRSIRGARRRLDRAGFEEPFHGGRAEVK